MFRGVQYGATEKSESLITRSQCYFDENDDQMKAKHLSSYAWPLYQENWVSTTNTRMDRALDHHDLTCFSSILTACYRLSEVISAIIAFIRALGSVLLSTF